MSRTIFELSLPDSMVEKFENLINNINSLANGGYIIIEKKTKKKDTDTTNEEIVATANGVIHE